jgi:hypothetical protein
MRWQLPTPKNVFHKHWGGFDEDMVMTEIIENRQWQIQNDDGTARCVFATTFTDAAIWKEKMTNPLFISIE